MKNALVLCYHGYRFAGSTYADNDFIALEQDLALIRRAGRRIVSAQAIAEALAGLRAWDQVAGSIALTFDDGTCVDFRAFQHTGLGTLRPFMDSLARHDARATSFVIASADARKTLERAALDGEAMLTHDWWSPALASGWIDIANHSWDHNHAAMAGDAPGTHGRGSFFPIDNEEAANWEIDQAQAMIASVTGRLPPLFAYPYGHVPGYLADSYLPRNGQRLGLIGAFTTAGCNVAPRADRWRIPRAVCGDHWRTPGELAAMLEALG